MKYKTEFSPAVRRREEILKRCREELKKQPEVSDEEFMAEFGVSDEEYDFGIVMPAVGYDEKE